MRVGMLRLEEIRSVDGQCVCTCLTVWVAFVW